MKSLSCYLKVQDTLLLREQLILDENVVIVIPHEVTKLTSLLRTVRHLNKLCDVSTGRNKDEQIT